MNSAGCGDAQAVVARYDRVVAAQSTITVKPVDGVSAAGVYAVQSVTPKSKQAKPKADEDDSASEEVDYA